MPAGDDDERKRRQVRWLAEAYSMAWLFPAAILLGLGFGYWMDKLFRTWPWLTIVFGAFGVIAAFINLFRLAVRDDGSGT
jgi:ATP synthase protein I